MPLEAGGGGGTEEVLAEGAEALEDGEDTDNVGEGEIEDDAVGVTVEGGAAPDDAEGDAACVNTMTGGTGTEGRIGASLNGVEGAELLSLLEGGVASRATRGCERTTMLSEPVRECRRGRASTPKTRAIERSEQTRIMIAL